MRIREWALVSVAVLIFSTIYFNISYGQVNSGPEQQNELVPLKKKYVPKFEITPFYGYQFNSTIDFIEGKLKIANAANFGGIFSYKIKPQVFAEFTYSRSNTTGQFREYDTGNKYPYDISIDYFQFGALKEFNTERIRPFALGSLGAAWANMKYDGADDIWRFSVAFGGGAKFILTDRIGIRLQGRLLLPMYFYGGGFYLGIGGGGPSGGVSLSSTARVIQGDLSAGLTFRIGDRNK